MGTALCSHGLSNFYKAFQIWVGWNALMPPCVETPSSRAVYLWKKMGEQIALKSKVMFLQLPPELSYELAFSIDDKCTTDGTLLFIISYYD